MDRPPSLPHHQNPNSNFFYNQCLPSNPNPSLFFRPSFQNPNTYSIAPPPPPVRELSGTLVSLQSLISHCQQSLDSLSQNLPLNLPSLLRKDENGGFVQCPFDPNHIMPPEALFLHSLRCPKPLDLVHLLGSFSSYRNKFELPCELQLNHGCDGLSFSLDNSSDFGTSFFYNDCPAVVNFSELDGKKRTVTLPSVLPVECCDLVDSDVKEKNDLSGKWLGILPSDLYAIKREIDQWRDYPSSYSYSVLSAILGSKMAEMSELSKWILVKSTRYGVIIDTYMRDHIFLLFRFCLKSIVKEALGLIASDTNTVSEQIIGCKSRTFECAVLVRVLSWLASQLAILYGEGNGKFFAIDMFKQCLVKSVSQVMLFQSMIESSRPRSPGVLKDSDETTFQNNSSDELGKSLDNDQVIAVSRIAVAISALYERSALERKIREVRYAQPLTRYQQVAELGALTAKADEERKRRSSYRPIIDHDGFPRQRLSNQEMNKMKTREELLAEERDYKRRRMSYRGKKVKRTPLQVLRDIIEEYTEEIKLAGGIGCFEKGMPLQSPSSTLSNNQKESDFGYNTAATISDASPRPYKQWKGENDADIERSVEFRANADRGKRYEEEYDSGSSRRQQSHGSHRSYKHSDRRDDHSIERKQYHHNSRSSHGLSDYKNKRDDRYDRRDKGSRNQSTFDDRYNPIEKERS